MTTGFRFLKYHGCGNDFILKDELEGPRTADAERSKLAMRLCDRHFQVGADGILFLEPGKDVDAFMRHFQPDGTESEMCGNGVRCVAAYLSEKLGKPSVDIRARDGVKRVIRVGSEYRVDMGRIRTRRADLMQFITDEGELEDSMMDLAIRIEGRELKGSLVSSGEAHFVVRTEDIDSEDVQRIGDSANKDRNRFPKGICINFVQVSGPHSIRVRTYESGAFYETLACGTGATASAGVAMALGWVRPGTVSVAMPGGTLRIDVESDGRAFMTGPAQRVFEGRLPSGL
ncbi:MAG TPA: diaminopimelate epimerase [Thermoplasmata archaeon]